MCHVPHRACVLLLLAASVRCTPSSPSLTGGAGDASPAFDASLPDADPPDGFILTQLAGRAGGTATSPDECGEPDAGDASAADGTGATRRVPDDATDAGDGSDAGESDGGEADANADACATPLAAGDLVFDEVMISSVAGSSDRGQWLEVRSTRSCSVDLIGLHASAPHGATARSMDVTEDVWLPAGGFFLIADTVDETENGALPGLVFAWSGSPADALHKTSDTITLALGGVTLDTLTYPDKKRAEGTSMAFPSNCADVLRADFSSWQPSTASWAAGFFGTPGAPNTDVTCAVPAIPVSACRGSRRAPRGRPRWR